ncbi:MAG: hypothetical protein A2562_00490 [Candidatus Nealsonbacteria bacterium RIFOXYD1_FULL_39_11]|nr:MAG: hypothetical protein A2562_00490 [Candidatus Nealsonbacteria bacterium RIFOXYD1_FULL_39_11]
MYLKMTKKNQEPKNMEQDINYLQVLQSIAEKIADLKVDYPQLAEFSPIANMNAESLVINYGYHTHQAEYHGGWASGVPSPDDDGIWFYIDFHDPDSQAQIHTQPENIAKCLGKKRVQFLILEGEKAKSLSSKINTILLDHGIETCDD